MGKKFFFIWFITIILMFTLIIFLMGSYMKDHPYLDVEYKIKTASKKYIKENMSKQDKYEVTSDELIKKGYIKDLTYKGKKCSGKVTIKYSYFKYYYVAKIKCE